MSHVLTDTELNRAMAVALGWTEHKSYWFRETPQGTLQTGVVPSYCTDRNLLPDVWAAVERRHQYVFYWRLLVENDPRNIEGATTETGHRWHALTAEPRLHVMSALKALAQWPDDWQAEP